MAIGDLAASAGLAVFAGTQDRRLGYQNDNQRGDELAAHMLTGGHALDGAGMSGVLPVAKGGTGGSTVQAARDALDVYSKQQVTDGLNGKADKGSTWTGGVATASTVNAATLTASGDVSSVNGNIVAGHDIGCGGRLQSTGSRGYQIMSGGVLAMFDPQGYVGFTPSIRDVKQDIAPWGISIDTFMSIPPVHFRFKSEVADKGDDAAVEVGFIANDFADAGLGQFTFNDPRTGDLAGLSYEKLPIILWSVMQQEITRRDEQIATLTARLEALETRNG